MRSDFESRLIRAEQLARLYTRRASKASDKIDRVGEMIFALATAGGQYQPTGPTIPGCSASIPTTLYARDPVYGAITLTWDGSAMWTACKSVGFPGYGATCAAVSPVAVHYDLMKTGMFRMRWASNAPSSTECPIASTCPDATNVTAQQTNPITVESCVPFRAHIIAGIGGGFVIFGNAANSGVRVDFSASPL